MCIWVHRWSICPVYRKLDHSLQRLVTPVTDPEQPWLSWKHGEVVDPRLLQKLGLTAPEEFVFVHHRVTSKRRCASWAPYYCNQAPREIHTQLYKSACSECTGEDRCNSLNVPYRIDIKGHDNLMSEQERDLDIAVAEYWKAAVLAKTAQLCEFIPGFDHFAQGPGELNPNSSGLFFDLACTEDTHHIHPLRGETSDCEWCNNVNFAPAHNLTRAVRRQEVLGVLENDFDAMMHQFDLLESHGEISRLRDLQHGDDAPQDWCPPEPQWNRVDAWHLEIARIGERIIGKGANFEIERCPDHQFQADGNIPDSWDVIIRGRINLAKHVASELTHDPGLSEAFFNKLFDYVVSLLLSCPASPVTVGGLDIRRCREPMAGMQMVHNFDCAREKEYYDEIMEAFNRSNSMVRDLSLRRDHMIANSKFAATIIRSDVERCTVRAVEAQSREGFCSICLEDWLPVDDIPEHLGIVAMPCCKKPVHSRCIKPLMRARAHKPTCPLCRGDLLDFGWFGPVYQDHIRCENPIGEGVVASIDRIRSVPVQDRAGTPQTAQQPDWEQAIGHWLDREFVAAAGDLDTNAARWEVTRGARLIRIEDYSGDGADRFEDVAHEQLPRGPCPVHGLVDEGIIERVCEGYEGDSVGLGNHHALSRRVVRHLPALVSSFADDGEEQGAMEVDEILVTPKTPLTPVLFGQHGEWMPLTAVVAHDVPVIVEDSDELTAGLEEDT